MAFFTKYFWCNFQAKLIRTSSKVCRWDLGDATWQYNLIVVCQMPSHRMDWIYKSDCMGHLLHVCGSAWHLSHTCPWRCENLNGSRWPCGAFARQMHAGWRDCTVTWRKEDDREITVLVFHFCFFLRILLSCCLLPLSVQSGLVAATLHHFQVIPIL